MPLALPSPLEERFRVLERRAERLACVVEGSSYAAAVEAALRIARRGRVALIRCPGTLYQEEWSRDGRLIALAPTRQAGLFQYASGGGEVPHGA